MHNKTEINNYFPSLTPLQSWNFLQSKTFHLPGKKALHAAENNFEVIVIDVSEHPIERPKKSSGRTIQERKSDIL